MLARGADCADERALEVARLFGGVFLAADTSFLRY